MKIPPHRSRAQVEALYSRYGPTIYSRCYRMLGDRSAAEDAIQEIFLRVLRHIEKAPDDSAALPWIYSISKNYCLNQLRNGQRQAISVEHLPEHPTDDFEAGVISRQFTERLMGELPPELRTPVALYHFKGMEQQEIAERLGVSRRTVLYRLGEAFEVARDLAGIVDLNDAFKPR